MKLFCSSCSSQILVDDEAGESTDHCPICGGFLNPEEGNAPLDETVEYSQVPTTIGRYEIERLLGSGGYGRVYLARDQILRRPVAIKVPRADRFSPADRQRFLEEAQLAARLRHSGIVTIYDAGIHESECYIAMEFVEAETLKQVMKRRRLTLAEIVRLIAACARAMHYAHLEGLIHRDLKPSNILLDAQLEPRIGDFGLAIELHEQWDRRGEVAGTPVYMSPEQMRGESHRLDGRTDIWSLGVILFELMTGTLPFSPERGRTYDEILNRDPRPPRQINDAIPVELERICLKCLSKSPGDRPNTALDLAKDLEGLALLSDPNASTKSGRLLSDTVATARSAAKPSARITMLAVAVGTIILTAIAFALSRIGDQENPSDKLAEPNPAPSSQPPEDGESRFLPLKWTNLLDRKPKVAYWLPFSATSRWNWDPAREAVSLDTDELGMLELGTTDADDFRLQTGIQRNSWSGFAGLYWGYREQIVQGQRVAECQILAIHTFPKEELQLRREVYRIEYGGGAPAIHSQGAGPTINLDHPGSEQAVLEIEIHQGTLKEVRWDGKTCFEGAESDDLSPKETKAGGGFGLINNSGATNFENARFFLLTGTPST